MFRLAHQEFLYLFALVPFFIIVFSSHVSMKKRALKKFGQTAMVQRLFADTSFVKPVIKFMLMMIALCFLIAGSQGRRWDRSSKKSNAAGSI